MDPKEFLTALWGSPPPAPVLIWRLPDRMSTWYTRYDRVCQDLANWADDDIYTCVGLPHTDPPLAKRIRGKAEQVTAIAGMWADVDIVHPLHKKTNLPPNMEKAVEVLESLPFTPTILVASGHGVQAWWLFDEPWIFQSHEERTSAQTLAKWWHEQVNNAFKKEGWAVDSVWDIARVMRVPGTTNNKDPDNPVPVTILAEEKIRFDRTEFLDRIPPDFKPVVTVSHDRDTNRVNGKGLQLDPEATAPTEKFYNLMDISPQFRATWEGKRKDLRDQSPSAYDMALASMAIHNGWTDQETANLLIHRRRKQGLDLKLRENYYATTISKARRPIEREEAQQNLTDAVEMETDHASDIIKESLSTVFGVGIIRLIKFKGDPPTYRMLTDQGDITLGKIGNITSQKSFRDLTAAATDVLIPKVNNQTWETQVNALLKACEEIDVGDSAHPVEETKVWLEAYLTERTITEELELAASIRSPFFEDGAVKFFLDDFRKWVESTSKNLIDAFTMSQRLKLCNAHQETVHLVFAGKRTTRSVWRLPEDIETGFQPTPPEELQDSQPNV